MVYLNTFEYEIPTRQLSRKEKIQRTKEEIKQLESYDSKFRKDFLVNSMISYRKERLRQLQGKSKWIIPFSNNPQFRFYFNKGRFRHSKPTNLLNENSRYWRYVDQLLFLESLSISDIEKYQINYIKMVSYRLDKLKLLQNKRIKEKIVIFSRGEKFEYNKSNI